MMKRLYPLLMLLAIALLINCGQTETQEEETRVPVTITEINRGNLEQTIEYQGDIKAEVEVRVFSKITDRIERLYVDAGDVVKKGEPIADISSTRIQQQVRQARAGLTAAEAQFSNVKAEYDRIKRLYGQGAVSEQQFDQMQTQYESAKAQLEQAEASLISAKSGLEDATVTAPISGIIGQRFVEEGDMASPGMPLVTVVQTENVEITFNATEEDLAELRVGQTAYVHVRSYKDRVFTGRVIKISPVMDPMTRMAQVKVLVQNKDKLLRSGMYARVEILTNVIENTIIIPRFATIENTRLERQAGEDRVVKNYQVFVAEDSTAVQRELDVEYANHERIAVRSGVSAGEKLIIEGQNNLKDEMPITVVKEDEAL